MNNIFFHVLLWCRVAALVVPFIWYKQYISSINLIIQVWCYRMTQLDQYRSVGVHISVFIVIWFYFSFILIPSSANWWINLIGINRFTVNPTWEQECLTTYLIVYDYLLVDLVVVGLVASEAHLLVALSHQDGPVTAKLLFKTRQTVRERHVMSLPKKAASTYAVVWRTCYCKASRDQGLSV